MIPYMKKPCVFRITAVLMREADPDLLKRAVADLVPRFPLLYTRLGKGFIWGHLAPASDFDIVRRDEGCPCRFFDLKEREKPLLRVLYRDNEISVETCHLTTDGAGAAVYLNSLIARYLELQGFDIEKAPNVLAHSEPSAESESDDYYRVLTGEPREKKKVSFPRPQLALRFPRKHTDNYYQLSIAEIPIDALKKLLKEKYGGCTVTEYLAAVNAHAFLQETRTQKRPFSLVFPVNLRNLWSTASLRNFSAVFHVNIKPDKRDYEFADILEKIRRELRSGITKENMEDFVYSSVCSAKIFDYIPGFIKKFIMSAVDLFAVLYPYTSSLSNLGYIKLPPSIAEHVRAYTFLVSGFGPCKVFCNAAGAGNVMSVTYGSVSDSRVIQNRCAEFFKKDGLPVVVRNKEYTTR